MSYTINVRVYQSNTDTYFRIVENSVWHYANGGTWANSDGLLALTMGGSGTAGMLRFQTEEGKESFTVALGVHSYKPWVHILTDIATSATCVTLLPDYYNGKHSDAVNPTFNIQNSAGRTISAEYKVAEGHNLVLNIVLG
ncbi:fruit body lectin [Xylariaceae sp. AK1471]|nr:fruit body lectin [Xylariaceae sp. AK1471]